MTPFALGLPARLKSGLRSGRIPDLLPTMLRRPRHQRTVLEALAEVGPAGMTPNSLEVTTELPEPRLNEALQDLMAAGLVCRQATRPEIELADDAPAVTEAVGVSEARDGFYLLTEHAPRST